MNLRISNAKRSGPMIEPMDQKYQGLTDIRGTARFEITRHHGDQPGRETTRLDHESNLLKVNWIQLRTTPNFHRTLNLSVQWNPMRPHIVRGVALTAIPPRWTRLPQEDISRWRDWPIIVNGSAEKLKGETCGSVSLKTG
jgi:hypothetical protein